MCEQVIIQRETVYERVQYQFEDDAYDTVPDLITYYVGSGKSISAASGARIRFPCNRTYPLSFYAAKYGISQMNNQPMVNSRGIGSPLNSPSLVNVGFRCVFNCNEFNPNEIFEFPIVFHAKPFPIGSKKQEIK